MPRSAGAGRTGTFIALSNILERVKAEGLLDVFQTVKSLRMQRPHMVQTVVSIFGPIQTGLECLSRGVLGSLVSSGTLCKDTLRTNQLGFNCGEYSAYNRSRRQITGGDISILEASSGNDNTEGRMLLIRCLGNYWRMWSDSWCQELGRSL